MTRDSLKTTARDAIESTMQEDMSSVRDEEDAVLDDASGEAHDEEDAVLDDASGEAHDEGEHAVSDEGEEARGEEESAVSDEEENGVLTKDEGEDVRDKGEHAVLGKDKGGGAVSDNDEDFVDQPVQSPMQEDPQEEDPGQETVKFQSGMDDTDSDGLSSDDDSFRTSSAADRAGVSVQPEEKRSGDEPAVPTKTKDKKRKHAEKKPKSAEKKAGDAPKQHAKQHETLLRILTPFMVPPGPGAVCVQTHRVVGVDVFVPESLPLHFQQSPKKPKTGKSLDRYERYKHATNFKQMFDLMMLVNTATGARLDFQHDLHAGLVSVTAPEAERVVFF
jgi:hypothetical protein